MCNSKCTVISKDCENYASGNNFEPVCVCKETTCEGCLIGKNNINILNINNCINVLKQIDSAD